MRIVGSAEKTMMHDFIAAKATNDEEPWPVILNPAFVGNSFASLMYYSLEAHDRRRFKFFKDEGDSFVYELVTPGTIEPKSVGIYDSLRTTDIMSVDGPFQADDNNYFKYFVRTEKKVRTENARVEAQVLYGCGLGDFGSGAPNCSSLAFMPIVPESCGDHIQTFNLNVEPQDYSLEINGAVCNVNLKFVRTLRDISEVTSFIRAKDISTGNDRIVAVVWDNLIVPMFFMPVVSADNARFIRSILDKACDAATDRADRVAAHYARLRKDVNSRRIKELKELSNSTSKELFKMPEQLNALKNKEESIVKFIEESRASTPPKTVKVPDVQDIHFDYRSGTMYYCYKVDEDNDFYGYCVTIETRPFRVSVNIRGREGEAVLTGPAFHNGCLIEPALIDRIQKLLTTGEIAHALRIIHQEIDDLKEDDTFEEMTVEARNECYMAHQGNMCKGCSSTNCKHNPIRKEVASRKATASQSVDWDWSEVLSMGA